jgi:LacI family transcriptional regulator
MLITASTNPFYSELVRGVERSCFERGYSLVLCNTEGDEQRMNRNLETLMQKRVDGLLLLCTETHQPSPEIMQRYPSVPTVMMDWAPFDGDSDLIQDNSLLGGDMATQYLIDQGIRALPVLPARWIKPRRVCALKVTMPRWRAADCRLPKDTW